MTVSHKSNWFLVRRAESVGLNYRIDGEHSKFVPSVLCPTCGHRWIQPGLDYPSVAPSMLAEVEPYLQDNPIAPDRFHALSAELDRILGGRYPIKPGSMFGPLEGRLIGPAPDIAFCKSWDIFLKESAYSGLTGEGIRGLVGVPAKLRVRGKQSDPLLEIQLEAHGRLARRSLPGNAASICRVCGYDDSPLPEMWWIDARALPTGIDLFRMVDLPAKILATDRFVEVVKKLNLTGAVFEPVNVDPS